MPRCGRDVIEHLVEGRSESTHLFMAGLHRVREPAHRQYNITAVQRQNSHMARGLDDASQRRQRPFDYEHAGGYLGVQRDHGDYCKDDPHPEHGGVNACRRLVSAGPGRLGVNAAWKSLLVRWPSSTALPLLTTAATMSAGWTGALRNLGPSRPRIASMDSSRLHPRCWGSRYVNAER